uniref:AAA+ ATPase domain-containing protein n=1 Tax=Anopheles coluzzii TaxID=1518534 RepID=A0A8W7Q0L0_ANOCL
LRVFRSRVANPKWIASIQQHGYEGGLELTATVDYLFGYDATAHVVDDWVYEELAARYALDPAMQQFFADSNPWALNAISERLLEAAQRQLWQQPMPETLAALQQLHLNSEAMLEARGVLIRGDKGSAKSTAAREAGGHLPPIRRVLGCAFKCDPASPLPECNCCQGEHAVAEDAAVPFVNLPLGASEDRVLGSLDFEQALKQARQAFKPGLLANAHRGLLYIDEVNLLADHLVDVLLDVAAMGVNTVQREGLSISHPARITLLGTMNQEEGELRPQLLDRFGLMVDVSAPRDAAIRSEVVRR